jgi:hypothetical protein
VLGFDVAVDSDVESIAHLDGAWAIACEIPPRLAGTPWYRPHDDLAEWVMWRSVCCAASPRYLLVCPQCRDAYLHIISHQGFIACRDCDEECDIIAFTELNKAAS